MIVRFAESGKIIGIVRTDNPENLNYDNMIQVPSGTDLDGKRVDPETQELVDE